MLKDTIDIMLSCLYDGFVGKTTSRLSNASSCCILLSLSQLRFLLLASLLFQRLLMSPPQNQRNTRQDRCDVQHAPVLWFSSSAIPQSSENLRSGQVASKLCWNLEQVLCWNILSASLC